MGIFSRRPKVPDPYVTYSLSAAHGPDAPFRPGSPVAGAITFSCPVQRQIRSFNVFFYGRCITHNTRTENSGPNNQTRTIHYHDEVNLFRYVQDLTPSTGAFVFRENQQCNFEFNFAFPTHTTISRADPYERRTAGSESYDVGVHELPPSFSLDYGGSKVADIQYRVEAAFLLDDSPEPFVVQFDPLPFAPLPPMLPPDYRPPFVEFVRKRETYSSSRLVGQEKSFRSSIRDKFSSHTPSLEVTMKASLVPVVTVGKPFELFVCVELSQLSDPKGISVPTVHLRVKRLRLYENTAFRALRVTRGYRVPENDRMDERDTTLNAVPDVRVVEQSAPPPAYQPPAVPSDSKDTKRHRRSLSSSSSEVGPANPPDLIFPTSFEARIPSSLVPSFRTVNINHHFQLAVEVEVAIAEKEFEHRFSVGDVTLLPPSAAPFQ